MKLTVDIYYPDAGKWEESKHPRDEEGRWTAGAYSAGAHKHRLAELQSAAPLSEKEDTAIAKLGPKLGVAKAKIPTIYQRLSKQSGVKPEVLLYAKKPELAYSFLKEKYKEGPKPNQLYHSTGQSPKTSKAFRNITNDPDYVRAAKEFQAENNKEAQANITSTPHLYNTKLNAEQLKQMDGIFRKHSIPLPRSTLLYRGVRLPEKIITSLEQAQHTKAEVRFDHPNENFVPTSASPKTAMKFANPFTGKLSKFLMPNKEKKLSHVLLEIVAAKGTRVLPSQEMNPYFVRGEREITLNRGAKFRVVGGTSPKRKDGLKTIRLELL